jgi:hypothetical protein
MMSELTLGQRVRFTHPMTRHHLHPAREVEMEYTGWGGRHTRTMKINKEWRGNQFAPATEGIIIGKRTLSNGYCQWEEYGTEYTKAEHFTAYMVVTDLRSKPVHVLPEHITPIEETHEEADGAGAGRGDADQLFQQ